MSPNPDVCVKILGSWSKELGSELRRRAWKVGAQLKAP